MQLEGYQGARGCARELLAGSFFGVYRNDSLDHGGINVLLGELEY